MTKESNNFFVAVFAWTSKTFRQIFSIASRFDGLNHKIRVLYRSTDCFPFQFARWCIQDEWLPLIMLVFCVCVHACVCACVWGISPHTKKLSSIQDIIIAALLLLPEWKSLLDGFRKLQFTGHWSYNLQSQGFFNLFSPSLASMQQAWHNCCYDESNSLLQTH